MKMRPRSFISTWQIPVLGFLGLILSGAFLLLVLPTPTGSHLSPIDALFMSTSATCVTGLSVMNIGTDLSRWGQTVLLTEIQLGGLGIMVISTVLLMALGRSLSIRSRVLLQDTYTHGTMADIRRLIKSVVLFTALFEGIGTCLLFARFHRHYDLITAFYCSVFHAISAFCNAGFCLFRDSFVGYQTDPLVNGTITGLIILGGIGFLVLHELFSNPHRNRVSHYWHYLSLHTKIVCAMTTFLLVSGTVFFLLSEWSDTLGDLTLFQKTMAAFFQSVTTRTAGFNTLEFASMNNITLLGTIVLMFVGASPGSTGGGIKTSTVGVLLALSRARLSGQQRAHLFKRAIHPESIDRAFSVVVLSVVIVMVATAMLLIFEAGNTPFAQTRGLFLKLLFETTSAFGTVGLSMGITSQLTFWSKFTLVLVMFTGRLGPLMLAMAIQPAEHKGRFEYAEERVMIG